MTIDNPLFFSSSPPPCPNPPSNPSPLPLSQLVSCRPRSRIFKQNEDLDQISLIARVDNPFALRAREERAPRGGQTRDRQQTPDRRDGESPQQGPRGNDRRPLLERTRPRGAGLRDPKATIRTRGQGLQGRDNPRRGHDGSGRGRGRVHPRRGRERGNRSELRLQNGRLHDVPGETGKRSILSRRPSAGESDDGC